MSTATAVSGVQTWVGYASSAMSNGEAFKENERPNPTGVETNDEPRPK